MTILSVLKTPKYSFFLFIIGFVFTIACTSQETQGNLTKLDIKIHECVDCKFEYMTDAKAVTHQSTPIEGSVEESIVELYLKQRYETYQYNYNPDEKYRFLGYKHTDLEKISEHLSFTFIYKFYYTVDNQSYCLTRFRITTEDGSEMMYHSRLILDSNTWKSINRIGEDRPYINEAMLSLKAKHLIDILSINTINEGPLNDLVNASQVEDKISLAKLEKNYKENKETYEPFGYNEKNHLPTSWWQKHR